MCKCPLCYNVKLQANNKVVGVWPNPIDILFCSRCELYFLKEMPGDQELENYYTYNYHKYNFITSFTKNIFRWFRSASQFKYLNNVLGKVTNKRILEIGAFDGMLLKFFKRRNAVMGLDFNSAEDNLTLFKSGVPVHNMNFFELTDKYDMVIMSHVIEHLSDLDKTVEKLKNLLTEEGSLFIEVPHSPKYPERSHEYIDGYLTTPHTYNFTPKSLEKLFIKHKMKIKSLDRFFYNIQHNNNLAEKISFAFLTGTGIDTNIAAHALYYIAKTFFNPANSFTEIPTDTQYKGPGDCLRIVVTN